MDGEAADPAAWLKAAVTRRLELAKAAGASRPQWSARYGVIVTDENDRDWAVLDLSPCIEDCSIGEHVAANDPRDTIARCEAELAILDEHRLVVVDPGGPEQGQSRGGDYRIIHEHPTERDIELAPMMWRVLHCRTCRVRPPCRTVRLLLGAYRFRSGYDEKWGAAT